MNLEGMMEMGWEFQPNHQTIEQIWDEIEALHRRVRLLTIGLIAVVVLCNCLPSLIWFLLPVKPFGAIQVERVEFVRGFDTILEIAPAPMGNAVFISSGSGRIIAGLGEDVVGSSLVLFNPNGTIAVGLGTMPDGGFIGIRDKDGRSCVHLSGRPFGGLLLIKSPQGQVLFRAP
jgi:hypothetical protein